MRERTRWMRNELDADLSKMRYLNNSKADKRTDEQNEQSRTARVNHYTQKWMRILNEAETAAQKHYCKVAIEAAGRIY